MLKNICFILLLIPSVLSAQSPKVGVRAGFDASKFLGPLENGESYDFSNGFHFGLSYSYPFTSYFGLTAELVYQQKGTQKLFNGPGYYHGYFNGEEFFEPGNVDMVLNISNAYLSLPIMAYVKPFKKLEFFAGLSFDFLINPVGTGLFTFESSNAPDDFFFEQSLSFQYYEDDPRMAKNSLYAPQVFQGEEVVTIPGAIGAYYHLTQSEEERERLFSWFNMSAVGGLSYYLRKSFYVSGRLEIGLFDQTNEKADYSLGSYNVDTFIFRDDRDVHFGYQFSFGFKF